MFYFIFENASMAYQRFLEDVELHLKKSVDGSFELSFILWKLIFQK
jgi:hypothetical protein